jgi:anti-anti-sigma regulatory factor
MTVATVERRPITARLPVDIDTMDTDELARVRLDLIAVVHVDAHHVTGLIIDLTRTRVVGSAQLRALRTMHEHACDLGIALCVAAPIESVRRLIYLADITERTPVFPSVGDALGACFPLSQAFDPRRRERAGAPFAPDTADWRRS